MLFFQANGLHSAADVNAYQIWYDLVGNGHGSADSTASAGVNVGHDAYLRAGSKVLVAKFYYLADSRLVDDIGKDLSLVKFAV